MTNQPVGNGEPEVVCSACRSRLRVEEDHAICTTCAQRFAVKEGVLDLRLQHDRSANDQAQEAIWDGNSAGSPSIPVDGLVCRNDFKSHLLRRLSDQIGWPGAGSATIDLGCFDGALSRNWTYRYQTRIHGVDQSLGAVHRARRVDPFDNQYHLASLEHLPFADHSFDAALCLDVLEHVNNVEPVVRELARVLKPEAPFLLYIVSARGRGTWDWWEYYTRRLLGLPTPARFGDNPEGGHDADRLVDPRAFREILRSAGFSVTRLQPFHAFFTVLYDDTFRRSIVAWRARRGVAESPYAASDRSGETRQMVLNLERLSPAKKRRLKMIERAGRLAEILDIPWTVFDLGRGFAVIGRKQG